MEEHEMILSQSKNPLTKWWWLDQPFHAVVRKDEFDVKAVKIAFKHYLSMKEVNSPNPGDHEILRQFEMMYLSVPYAND